MTSLFLVKTKIEEKLNFFLFLFVFDQVKTNFAHFGG